MGSLRGVPVQAGAADTGCVLDWRIETRHAEHLVLLGCDACETRMDISTESPRFLDSLSGFLEGHSRCAGAPALRSAAG